MRGQASIILILLIIVLFGGMAIFLVSFADTVSQEDYINKFTTNLLLSIVRADTGNSNSDCKLVSDAIFCAITTPGKVCDNGIKCYDLAEDTINRYMGDLTLLKKNFNYSLVIEGTNFISDKKIEFTNDPEFDTSARKTTKWTAQLPLQKTIGTKNYNIKARLIISRD
jgi:hypothetical protein